ncbi:MAG: helix-turn-helix transcriptional regulator [Clostridia bacterium]|nr:helix-turn-helix transcriptional regulator [Clostridia bacterium]
MTAKQVIEMGLAYAGKSQRDLAQALGWTPQLLNNRIKTGKFSVEEWEAIAKAIGSDLRIGFRFPDGKET